MRSILEITQNQNQNLDEEDRELVMALSPIYLQHLEDAKQEGIQQTAKAVIENLLQVRFGFDNELNTIIEPISKLSPQVFTPLLLQLSHEELLNRFRQP